MTKINVATDLVSFDGEKLVRVANNVCPACGRSDPVDYWTVRIALTSVLLNAKTTKSNDAYDNYRLGLMINNREEDEDGNCFIEFTSTEIVKLQTMLVGLPTIIVGQVWGILEGKDVHKPTV